MHYFIDGYNLMFRMSVTNETLQSEREKFIADLYEKIQVVSLDVTIVFDAQYQEGMGSRTHLDFLEICFTDEGETADDYIINELGSTPNPREEIIVTSDNNLAWRARRMHAKTEPVEEFMRWLDHRYKKKKKELPLNYTPIKAPKISIPEEVLDPITKGQIDQTYDYYLKTFEKKIEGQNIPEKKSPPKEVETIRPGESDEDRWLRLFEGKLENDES